MTAASRPERHPQDWYVEQAWTVRALMAMVPFDREHLVWDPCCGLGTIPTAFDAAGVYAVGTDLVDRWLPGTPRHQFMGEHDFLGDQRHILDSWSLLSVVFNPPYGYEDDIAERCVRRALSVASDKVCALLPIRWRASEKRYAFFQQFPCEQILEFCDRPSMPPGTALHDRDPKTGALTAWRRGMTDYAWYVWDRQVPKPDTLSRLIVPRTPEQKRVDRDFDLRRVGALPPVEMEIAA